MLQFYTRISVCAAVGLVAVASAVAAKSPRVGASGVTVVMPGGWHATEAIQGPVTNPLTRIVVSSGPIRPDLTSSCQVAAYSFPRTAVAIVVVEWTEPLGGMKIGAGPRRPRHFTATTLPLQRPPAIECFDGSGGSAEFAEHGRSLAAYVLLGRNAPERLAGLARAVLDTLRVTRR
jgi:hypothetical protein